LEEQRRRDTDNKAWEVKSRANIDEISRLRWRNMTSFRVLGLGFRGSGGET
jgi:hypothetical protein